MDATTMAKRRVKRNEATIREVAAAAGVSMMTVSNVVNGRFDQMSEGTRLGVERAIERLNYRPYLVARHLRRSGRLSIGLLFIDETTFVTHPFHSHIVAGLGALLNERGYSLTLRGIEPGHLTEAPIQSPDTDALCVVQSGSQSQRLKLVKAVLNLAQPCVLINETDPPANPNFCCVSQDDYGGGQLLAIHLIERGCRLLLMILPTTIWASMEERARGVRAICRQHRVPLAVIRTPSPRIEGISETLDRYLSKNPIPHGILAGNDHIGMGTLQYLHRKRIDVPGNVRVTGFNAFEFWKYSDPLLTTIRSPAEQLGAESGRELLRRLTEGRFSSDRILLPVELVVGAST